ncbi:hypothetical protein HHK36_016322 [Tetracentron sinense]|uniref:Uncharacterized protein n=1 Tax=Tetracentron sinense TaxID=13715 RepID=A0A834Z2J3_TETSI|nr:hypothetical protein HHK36_016322 [Tetracentron sinense]
MSGDRKIGVAMDFSKSSKSALKWAIDNLRTRSSLFTSKPTKATSPATFSEPIPVLFREPELMIKYDVRTDPEVLDILDTACGHKEVNLPLFF